MDQFKWLSLIFLLILSLLIAISEAQGGAGGDDGSSVDQDQDQQPEPADPNLVAPTNRQGYGKDVQTSLTKAQAKPMKISHSTQPPIGEQSILAMQQFAVLVNYFLLYIVNLPSPK